jgi:predicted amidohydrolase YtcJ
MIKSLRLKLHYFSFLLVLLFGLNQCNYKALDADLIVHNAKIYSLNHENKVYQAMAIKDGKIIALGVEREILNQYTAKETFDAKTKVIYPGFIDAHGHFLGLGLSQQQVNLVGVKSFKEMVLSTAKQAKEIDFEWVYGWGWDHNTWPDKQYPKKEVLDSLFPERPVLLRRIDGHSAIVNQATLDIAGFNAETKIDGGDLLKNNGKLNGILVDNAMYKAMEYMPEFTLNQKVKALKYAQENLFQFGIVSTGCMGLPTEDILLIDSLQKVGELNISVMPLIADKEKDLEYWFNRGTIQSEKLAVTGIKTYFDGALGSRGAALKQPYSDAPDTYGLILNNYDYFWQLAKNCKDYGFQLVGHAIGDSAAKVALDIYGDILEKPNDLRWRIEHCQILDSKDIHKFRDFTIIPSVQPTHYLSDKNWAIKRIGQERMETAYLSQTLLNQLGMIAFGTDFPIESPDPLRTFTGAVFRGEPKEVSSELKNDKETISRLDALKAMTLWPAIAGFSENYRGTLEIGKQADFIITNIDLLKVSPDEITKFKVENTFIEGQKVF